MKSKISEEFYKEKSSNIIDQIISLKAEKDEKKESIKEYKKELKRFKMELRNLKTQISQTKDRLSVQKGRIRNINWNLFRKKYTHYKLTKVFTSGKEIDTKKYTK